MVTSETYGTSTKFFCTDSHVVPGAVLAKGLVIQLVDWSLAV